MGAARPGSRPLPVGSRADSRRLPRTSAPPDRPGARSSRSVTTRWRCASTTGTGSTASAWLRATRTGCSTRTGTAACRVGASWNAGCSAGTSARVATSRMSSSGACGRECDALVLSNVQPHAVVPFIVAARRLEPADRRARRELGSHRRQGRDRAVLRRLHRPERGDARRSRALSRHRPGARRGERLAADRHLRAAAAAERLRARFVRAHGLDPSSPLVVVMGNTPANTPFEDKFVARMVDWWKAAGRGAAVAPLPPASRATASGASGSARRSETDGIAVQEASYTDFEELATLLQHCDCVVANAGTILLDALVNDRPAVCVLYDEGAPPGESFAMKNVVGEHYRELAASDGVLSRGVASTRWSRASSGRSRIPRARRRATPCRAPGGRRGRRARRRARGRRDRSGRCELGVGPRPALAEEPAAAEQTNAGATGSTKWRSANRPSGVQEHDRERRERQRDERRPAARAAHSDRDQAEQDPHPWPREPARELVEPERELRVARAVRERVEERG